jgi:two-component system, NarL family, capsular synthesis sensor histidine kinase RcsC
MDQSVSTQVPMEGRPGVASQGGQLSALRRYQRQLLYGGGGLLTLIILLAGVFAALSNIDDFHLSQRQVFREGQAAANAFLTQRERAYANSINANDIIWATQQNFLIQAGTPLAQEFLAQGEQATVPALNKANLSWLVLGDGAAAMPATTLAAYLGMLREYSAYTAPTVASAPSSDRLISYAYDPSGKLLVLTGIRDEAQLQQILKASTRQQAFAVLMREGSQVKTLGASDKGISSANEGRLVSYYGENPFTGKPSLIGITTLMADGKVYFHRVMFEEVDNLKASLATATSGAFGIFTPEGQAVLEVGNVPPLSAVQRLHLLQNEHLSGNTSSALVMWREHGVYIVAGQLQGFDWTLLHFYRWQDVLAAKGWQLGMTGAVALLILGLLWALLLRLDRRVFAPALADASRVYESEALNRTIIETSPVGLCLLDPSSGRPILRNDVVHSVIGMDDASDVEALFHQLVTHVNEQGAATSVHEFQWTLDLPEKHHRHLQVAMASSSYRNQSVWVCALRDITAQTELEENLRRARHDSEQARIAAESASQAKTAFVATMSHEIRTPLNGVLGHLELLSRSPLNPSQRERLDRIRLSADALLGIISDVLDFSRIEAGQLDIDPTPFELRPLIEQAALLFAPAAQRKGVKLYFSIDPILSASYVSDVHRLRQILNNLLGNAVKFTESGRIIVRVTPGEPIAKAPTWLRFQVVDSGIGMSEQQLAGLFQPFTQADASISRRFGGSGLGLALCQQLSHLLGGRISAESTQEVGSVFTLDVPVGVTVAPTEMIRPLSGSRVALLSAAAEWRAEIGALLKAWGATVMVAALPGDLKSGIADVLLIFGEPRSWSADEEQELLSSYARVIRAYANGPLIPEQRDDGVFVSCYASEALLSALRLDSDRNATAPSRTEVPIHTQVAAGRGRILLVEDNPVNRELIQQQLGELGFDVDTAEHGEAGLRRWKPATYVAVLTDINMPQMSGYELAEALRKRGEGVPIMAITATALASEKARCREVGITEVLLKPLTLESLNDALSRYAGERVNAGEAIRAQTTHQAFPEKIRRTFVDRGTSDLAILRDALASRDARSLIDVVHSFKGALLMLGESDAARECSVLEDRLRQEEVEKLDVELKRLADLLQAVVLRYKANLVE